MSKWRAIGPIYNFNPICEELKFTNFIVRRFSEEELDNLLSRGREYWSDVDFGFCKYYPWFLMEYEADAEKEWDVAATKLEIFFNALSLFKSTSTILHMGQFYVGKLEGEGVSGRFGGALVPTCPPVYILEKGEYEEFIRFYNKYNDFVKKVENNPQRKRINFATNFFRRVRQTSNLTERLIFLSVSLEALFSHEKDELKYRYSHRAALLLGVDSKSRSNVFDIVRDFYDRRSEVLHGSLEFKLTPEETSLYNEVIRASILKYVSLHLSGRKIIIEDLDDLIFDENGRDKLLAEANEYFGAVSDFKCPANIGDSPL